MRVLLINTVCGQGSTGRICIGIADMLKAKGHEVYIAYGLGNSNYPDSINISGGKCDYLSHNILSRITDSEGLHSNKATKKLIAQIKKFSPDVIHIHTLHGHYINYKLLFKYLQTTNLPIVITLHDCWLFTGHCAHFVMRGCEKWKVQCCNCQFMDEYPKSWFIDRSKRNFNLKRQLLTALQNKLTIVPVSYWLENYVKQSFLKYCRIKTIHNGIDLNIFKPSFNKDLIDKYSLCGKRIILGVALPWSSFKGFPDFLKLHSLLSKEFIIVMVGVSDAQKQILPKGIIGIERTDSTQELAILYSAADVLVNTTYCDNYPTVNLEAIACGTPVVTYRTGGSPESIVDGITGKVITQGDVPALKNAIEELLSIDRSILRANCRKYALSHFDKEQCFLNYLDLYK